MNTKLAWLPDANLRFRITDKISFIQANESIDSLLGFAIDGFRSASVSFVDRIHADDQDIARTVFSPQATETRQTCNLRPRQASGRICCFKATYQRHGDREDVRRPGTGSDRVYREKIECFRPIPSFKRSQ